MKKFKNAFGMVSVFAILTLIVSCGPGGAGGGDPITPNPKPEPTISSFSASTNALLYNGQPNSGRVVVSWSTVNAKVYLNDVLVANTGSITTDTLFQNTKFTLKVTDVDGKNVKSQDLNISVSVDPTFAKICGTVGQSWKITSRTAQSTNGTVETLQNSELDDIYTFYPTGRSKAYYGTVNPLPVSYLEEEYKFFPLTSEVAIQHYDVQPIRKVEFIGNTMTWTHIKNNVTYVSYFQKI